MVATAMVCHWPGRRLDSISRFAPESYRSADDLLATATATRIRGYDIFRHLLLPWQRRSFSEPGVAIERRSRYPGVYEPVSARHARAMDNRFHRNYCGSAGEYVTNGPGGRTCIDGRHWPAFWPGASAKLPGAQKSVAIAGALAIILALIALAQATHLEQPLNRWQSVVERIPADARWQASRVALGALPHAGFFGFGPGTFRVVFPGYNIGSGHAVPGTWRFLHEDYLQTVLEWGWLGSSLWALLFFGGIAVEFSATKICEARLDAEKTRDAAFGYRSPRGSGDACAGRFSISNRVDPAVCRDVSGCVLGKQLVVRQVRDQTSQFRDPGQD